MEYLAKNISENLKQIRKSKNMSLDMVAEQTGVSKSMLAQIERGEANPTIGILGRIVSGLRMEFQDLISTPKKDGYLIEKRRLSPTKESPGQYRVYTVFPFGRERRFEIYEIEVEPGCVYGSGAHGEGTKEYIVVTEGELTVRYLDEKHMVQSGDGFYFSTNKEHFYCNDGIKLMKCVVYFCF